GVDPLAKRLFKTVIAVGDVLGGTPRTRWRDAAGGGGEGGVAEIVLCRHRAGPVPPGAVERWGARDAAPAPPLPEARDLVGGGVGRRDRRGQQYKPCDQQGRTAPHSPVSVHCCPSLSDPRLLPRHCGRFKAQLVA